VVTEIGQDLDQALSVLKHQSLERKIKLHSAAVVERTPTGTYAIKESETPRAGSTTSTGGLIGALVGILGYYVMISMTLNVFRMMPPADAKLAFAEPK
jgi:uncharacterized membrane protein